MAIQNDIVFVGLSGGSFCLQRYAYSTQLKSDFAVVIMIRFIVLNQCDHGEVQSVGGSGPQEGRVEICNYSQWGRVCSYLWDDDDARVVCRQLGYSPRGN